MTTIFQHGPARVERLTGGEGGGYFVRCGDVYGGFHVNETEAVIVAAALGSITAEQWEAAKVAVLRRHQDAA